MSVGLYVLVWAGVCVSVCDERMYVCVFVCMRA